MTFAVGTIGVNEDFIDLCLLELKKELNSDDIDPDILKSRVIMKAVARKWKEFTVKNRGKAELRLVKRTQIKNPLDELVFTCLCKILSVADNRIEILPV